MSSDNKKQEYTTCSVINCGKKIKIGDAQKIQGKYFCKSCAVAYFRTAMNL